MRMKRFVVIAAIPLMSMACDEQPETVEVEQAAEVPAAPVIAEDPVEPVVPVADVAVTTISKATYEMSLWADAPEAINPGPDTVVLQYENFPGHYERFDASLVKDCVLANEKKPFKMTVYRYTAADEDTFERVVALEPCPDLKEQELAAQWLEAERLREGRATPDAAEPAGNKLGWAGRGFYRVEGGDPETRPSAEWQTFCGGMDQVACDAALRTGTGDRQ